MKRLLLSALVALSTVAPLRAAPYQMENLGRGVIAMRTGSNSVYVGWRHLGLDPSGISYNLYRGSTKVNASPITNSTNLVDTGANLSVANTYTVRPVIGGVEQAASAGYTLPANAATQQYIRIAGSSPGSIYSPGDCSVGDVDGDGEYEIFLKWDPSDQKDNSQNGITSNVYIDCYRLNGTQLWRINLGPNIRAGAHYTQFQVYDYDGDGRAELAVKTADGTVSGTGVRIGTTTVYRNANGHIITGPEFLTVFNGLTGAAMSTVNFEPNRGTLSSWGDSNGNRSERYLAGTAYLDGTRPSIIMARGYYERSCIAAWDFRNGALTLRWKFDSDQVGSTWEGRGTHWFSVADVDNNGNHEIVYGGMTLNANGSGRYTTNFYAHGDALHVSDFLPSRAGQEIWQIHEQSTGFSATLRDANTGAIIWSKTNNSGGEGPARGAAGDIYAGSAGAEFWGFGAGLTNTFNTTGGSVGRTPSSANFLVWWDADVIRELLDQNRVDKYGTSADTNLFTASGASSINGTKATPCLSADLFGDWREEIILREGNAIRIYTTTTVATNRVFTLMHDPQYRCQVACQNSAYNQPPHPSFFLGSGTPPNPSITYVGGGGGGNVAPSVSITSPTNGQTFTAGANITINATASDSDGTVSSVQFFQGSTSLGTDTTSGYSVTWNAVPAGTYVLTARATDDDGAQTTSAPITITVGTGGGADTYQAESATLAGGSAAETTNGGFNGTGYVNSPATGGSITFNNVDGNGGGSKVLAIRYANGSGATRTGQLVINGTTTNITFATTTNWTTWATHNVTITLNNTATNTIRLNSTGQDLANIDQITVP